MNPIDRLVSLIASSSISDEELADALNQLFRLGSDNFRKSVVERRIRGIATPRFGEVAKNSVKMSPKRQNQSYRDVAYQIDQLLRAEAGLSSEQAESRLVAFFPSHVLPIDLPSRSRSKISFRDWIERLSAFIPPKELLHAATLIRNDVVHSGRTDWPLKR